MEDKRLIEVDFPLKEVSEESVREKNIRHGHISTLHIWWARRPLAASRATTFATLIPAPKDRDELRRKFEFVAELSKWENSLNQRIMETAKKEIKEFFRGRQPRILDCFAGGGAIPLEALRLGCETFALEYNPVAVLILKAVLEYPQKFRKGKNKVQGGLYSLSNSLAEEVKRWGNWVLEETRKEIGKFYPPDPDGSVPISYIWARTVKCQNPSCGVEIPLMRQFWLAKKENKKIALKIIADKKNKRIDFGIAKDKEIDFDPSIGTIRRATVLCPVCGAGLRGKDIQKQAVNGILGHRMVVVVLQGMSGKTYRIAKEEDINAYKNAENILIKKQSEIIKSCGIDPVPDELGPPKETHRAVGSQLPKYGFRKWADLFNSRQKLTIITLIEKIKFASRMMEKNMDNEYARAVITYLALGLSRLTDYYNSLCIWDTGQERTVHVFARSTLPMVWDYSELNPFSETVGSWKSMLIRRICTALDSLSKISADPANVAHGSAVQLPYPNDFFDAVITDPPYYDNVPYADLSDFFYVWLKRVVSDYYKELFATPLTPKTQEIIQNSPRMGSNHKARKFFEENIGKAFNEISRVLKSDGVACIVFAHKSTDAWESIIKGLLKSGLYISASWPIHTEMKIRLQARGTASLASSIYMICRKRKGEKVAYFNDIKEEITERIKERLHEFWEQGISGADFFVSAIGPAVEVFGKYSKIERLSGEEVSVQELLEYVRKVVSEFALERVLKRADLGGVDIETRFYLLWRWAFGNAKMHFDEAIKLSRPMGVELTNLWDTGGLVKKDKEFIKVLAPHERAKDQAFLKKTKFTSMIDVLHYVLALWERGEREKIKQVLNETGYAGNEVFWQTAQAISEILPQGDKEKQLLQGFLYGKEVYVKEARGKTSLLDYMEGK
jgi:adenine-specific DNA methylase